MSLGVVRYCTPEGGSGFVDNPALPWLSTFDITQMAPVYDQTPGWLRDSKPGTYTNYPRFGPPYSVDGGVLSPYYLDSGGQPVPVSTAGCGMGAVDPGQFEAQYGRPEPDMATCMQIQCGAISQSQAGPQLITDCMNAGYGLARSCFDPACSPWRGRIPGCSLAPNAPAPVLLRSDVVAPMPSITSVARGGCKLAAPTCPSDLTSWIGFESFACFGACGCSGSDAVWR